MQEIFKPNNCVFVRRSRSAGIATRCPNIYVCVCVCTHTHVHASVCVLVGTRDEDASVVCLPNLLDASSHLYKRLCPFFGPSVHNPYVKM